MGTMLLLFAAKNVFCLGHVVGKIKMCLIFFIKDVSRQYGKQSDQSI